jgi:WD40 repeat protein
MRRIRSSMVRKEHKQSDNNKFLLSLLKLPHTLINFSFSLSPSFSFHYLAHSGGASTATNSSTAHSTADNSPYSYSSTSFSLVKKYANVHSLGVSSLTLVTEQNFLISTSFDTTVRVMDAITGSVFMTIENCEKVRYTGVCWNASFEILLTCDMEGYIEAYNVYNETRLARTDM